MKSNNATLENLYQLWRSRETKIDEEVSQIRKSGITDSSEFEKQLSEKFGDEYPNHWFKVICQPIAEQIKSSGNFSKVVVLGPMGIGARISFHCYKNEDDSIEEISSLTVEPNLEDDHTSVLSRIDFNVNTEKYAKNTVGHNNGLNYGVTEIKPSTQGKDWLSLLDA